MAGAGAKLFTDGSVLNAAQVNTYLMDQSIMRFATTTARDAAFGGAGEPVLAEGMTCYIDADNSLYSYDGSNWVRIITSSAPSGLELITSCTVTSVGGTSATASGGIITIGTSNTSVTVSSAFSSTYANYVIVISGMGCSANGTVCFIKLSGSTGSTYNSTAIYMAATSNVVTGTNLSGNGNGMLWNVSATTANDSTITLFEPNINGTTRMTSNYTSTQYYGTAHGHDSNTAQHTGFVIGAPTSQTISGGTIRVYGYRNS